LVAASLSKLSTSRTATQEIANLVYALTLISAISTEFLSQNLRVEFAEMLRRIDTLLEAAIEQRRKEGPYTRASCAPVSARFQRVQAGSNGMTKQRGSKPRCAETACREAVLA
jgi:hypothetical protein